MQNKICLYGNFYKSSTQSKNLYQSFAYEFRKFNLFVEFNVLSEGRWKKAAYDQRNNLFGKKERFQGSVGIRGGRDSRKNPSFPNRITPKKEHVYGSVVRPCILEKLSFLSYL